MKEYHFIESDGSVWVFCGNSQKQALIDCANYFQDLVWDAKEKNFSKDSEFYDLFEKVELSKDNCNCREFKGKIEFNGRRIK